MVNGSKRGTGQRAGRGGRGVAGGSYFRNHTQFGVPRWDSSSGGPSRPGQRRCLPARRVFALSLQRTRRGRGQRAGGWRWECRGRRVAEPEEKEQEKAPDTRSSEGRGSWREEEDLRRGGRRAHRRSRETKTAAGRGRAVGGAGRGRGLWRLEGTPEGAEARKAATCPAPRLRPRRDAGRPSSPACFLAAPRAEEDLAVQGCSSAGYCSEYKRAFLTPLRPSRPGTPGRKGLARWTLETTAVGATPPFLWFLQRSVVPSIYFKGHFNNDYNDDFCPLFQFKRKNKQG